MGLISKSVRYILSPITGEMPSLTVGGAPGLAHVPPRATRPPKPIPFSRSVGDSEFNPVACPPSPVGSFPTRSELADFGFRTSPSTRPASPSLPAPSADASCAVVATPWPPTPTSKIEIPKSAPWCPARIGFVVSSSSPGSSPGFTTNSSLGRGILPAASCAPNILRLTPRDVRHPSAASDLVRSPGATHFCISPGAGG